MSPALCPNCGVCYAAMSDCELAVHHLACHHQSAGFVARAKCAAEHYTRKEVREMIEAAVLAAAEISGRSLAEWKVEAEAIADRLLVERKST